MSEKSVTTLPQNYRYVTITQVIKGSSTANETIQDQGRVTLTGYDGAQIAIIFGYYTDGTRYL